MATGIEDIPDWARSCSTGKRKYSSAEDARKQNKSNHGGKTRGTPKPYRCPECDYYHITTSPRTRWGTKHRG
jgi:hypothetical protein